MTYNPPFLYRCEYDDGKTIERQHVFGEAAMEDAYTYWYGSAVKIPGSRIVIEYYDRRRKKWRPVVRYINKGGDNNAP